MQSHNYVLGIFEKPDAEALAAAKSRRLNLLEVKNVIFYVHSDMFIHMY